MDHHSDPSTAASAVIDRWVALFNANDAEAILRLYAPDATLHGTSSPILSKGPEAIGRYFSRLPGSGNRTVLLERHMVVLDENTVLGMGFYEPTRVTDGKPTTFVARFTMVIARRGDEWLILHHHSSVRPTPPQ
jgi:uncharacterized protein (TIGR02246 family)